MRDYLGYSGKVCVVTGASSGMGASLAEMLIDCGAQVWTASRGEVTLEGQAGWVKLDQVSRESIDAAFAQLPEKIDCFFGVAGVSGLKNDYVETFTIDFVANKYLLDTYLSKRVAPGGSITFVTSTLVDSLSRLFQLEVHSHLRFVFLNSLLSLSVLFHSLYALGATFFRTRKFNWVLTTLVIILLSIVPNTQVSAAEATTTDILITDLVALCWTILNFWLSYRLFCRQQVIGKFINW